MNSHIKLTVGQLLLFLVLYGGVCNGPEQIFTGTFPRDDGESGSVHTDRTGSGITGGLGPNEYECIYPGDPIGGPGDAHG